MINKDLLEQLSAKVHEAWMDLKREQGITSRLADDGEEQMVPYNQLSERSKDADRQTVIATLKAAQTLGYNLALHADDLQELRKKYNHVVLILHRIRGSGIYPGGSIEDDLLNVLAEDGFYDDDTND